MLSVHHFNPKLWCHNAGVLSSGLEFYNLHYHNCVHAPWNYNINVMSWKPFHNRLKLPSLNKEHSLHLEIECLMIPSSNISIHSVGIPCVKTMTWFMVVLSFKILKAILLKFTCAWYKSIHLYYNFTSSSWITLDCFSQVM